MNYCVICHQPIVSPTTWVSLFTEPILEKICRTCKTKIIPIQGDICSICGRPLKELPTEYIQNQTCLDCIRWEQNPKYSGLLKQNRSLYRYNDAMKDIMAMFKFRGDYALIEAFQPAFQRLFQTYYNNDNPPIIIPIPLSPERLYERAFNQAVALASILNLRYYEIMTRSHSEKQSKKSREDRLNSITVFNLRKDSIPTNKHILLIDDIYTTGTTLRQAAHTLKEMNPKSISSFTICRS